MAIRYSGNVTIRLTYKDAHFWHGEYVAEGYYGRVIVNGQGYSSEVRPPLSGFGSGIAYDSPEAYDEIARSMVAFAGCEHPEVFEASDGEIRRKK